MSPKVCSEPFETGVTFGHACMRSSLFYEKVGVLTPTKSTLWVYSTFLKYVQEIIKMQQMKILQWAMNKFIADSLKK